MKTHEEIAALAAQLNKSTTSIFVVVPQHTMCKVRFTHDFSCKQGGGYTFDGDVDVEGVFHVDWDAMIPEARLNYLHCLLESRKHLHEREITDLGVKEWPGEHIRTAIGICEICGHNVVLNSNTNNCNHSTIEGPDCCTAIYNMSGQRLNEDRSCWGEETGEHPADIERSEP
jgi:hypothetical protein